MRRVEKTVQLQVKFQLCTNVVHSAKFRFFSVHAQHGVGLENPPPASNLGVISPLFEPRLPVPLHSLEGPKRSLKRLQAVLREIESGARECDSVATLCEKLKTAGYTKELLAETIRIYLAGESQNKVLEDLDLRLLACHHVLLEDLSPDLLEELLNNPELMTDSEQFHQVWEQLYGESSLPLLTPEGEQKRASSFNEKHTTKRRQLVIERLTVDAALREYRESQKHQEEQGMGSIGLQRIWKAWINDLADTLRDPDASFRGGRGSMAFKELQKICGAIGSEETVTAETLAVIACQTTLNLLFLPSYRHKDDVQRDVQDGKWGEVPWVTVASTIGEMVQMERCSMDSATTLKGDARDRVNYMFRRVRKAESQDMVMATHFGAALADVLISRARVEVPAEQAPEMFDKPPKPGEKVLVQAFHHRLRRDGKRKQVGVISLHPAVRSMIESEDLLRFLQPKHKPMIIPPEAWKPSGAGPQGPYLLQPVEFVRTTDQKMTCLRSYNPTRVAGVMDFLGQMPWKVNRRILELMETVWKDDLGVAGVPQKRDPEVPLLPTEEEQNNLSDQELKDLRLRRSNAQKARQTLQSERPTFELKLGVANEFFHAEQVYFPQNVDFRGRSYPIPPHLNHIGDDVSRGLLMFAEGKALGPHGLFWLKVNLANLFGKNKVSLEDRAAWVDSQKDLIVQVAQDPLKEENMKWWSSADDGPWQALARCLELSEIWSSDAPEEYKSHLPVHMDGSCNGLQHYAALGRDIAGAQAVNLVPAEKPQDVYTFVLNVVKKKVHDQATAEALEEDQERKKQLATRLIELDVLQRKVVKQTVMTICYGVTRIGAYRQVKRHMSDFLGDQVDPAELPQLAKYLSRLVLDSIHDVFIGAKRIQNWFDIISKQFNSVQAPVCWMSPMGFSCAQPYRKAETVRITARRQSVTLKTGEQILVNKDKQGMGFPPNFIHSLDATHMMMVAERCKKQGIYFAAVHDSFWTHACDVPLLNESIREAFVELYEKPVLQDFYEDLCLHLGGQQVPPLPELGDLDISVVKNSTYLFS